MNDEIGSAFRKKLLGLSLALGDSVCDEGNKAMLSFDAVRYVLSVIAHLISIILSMTKILKSPATNPLRKPHLKIS